jgi:hypothetical protein
VINGTFEEFFIKFRYRVTTVFPYSIEICTSYISRIRLFISVNVEEKRRENII